MYYSNQPIHYCRSGSLRNKVGTSKSHLDQRQHSIHLGRRTLHRCPLLRCRNKKDTLLFQVHYKCGKNHNKLHNLKHLCRKMLLDIYIEMHLGHCLIKLHRDTKYIHHCWDLDIRRIDSCIIGNYARHRRNESHTDKSCLKQDLHFGGILSSQFLQRHCKSSRMGGSLHRLNLKLGCQRSRCYIHRSCLLIYLHFPNMKHSALYHRQNKSCKLMHMPRKQHRSSLSSRVGIHHYTNKRHCFPSRYHNTRYSLKRMRHILYMSASIRSSLQRWDLGKSVWHIDMTLDCCHCQEQPNRNILYSQMFQLRNILYKKHHTLDNLLSKSHLRNSDFSINKLLRYFPQYYSTSNQCSLSSKFLNTFHMQGGTIGKYLTAQSIRRCKHIHHHHSLTRFPCNQCSLCLTHHYMCYTMSHIGCNFALWNKIRLNLPRYLVFQMIRIRRGSF